MGMARTNSPKLAGRFKYHCAGEGRPFVAEMERVERVAGIE